MGMGHGRSVWRYEKKSRQALLEYEGERMVLGQILVEACL